MERSVYDVNFGEEFKIITHPELKEARERLREELADLDFTAHYAIFSSGTTSRELKGYILSEKAMEANARAVNEWFALTRGDVWGLSLPVYHVGGLSVLVRARLLGNKVIDLRKWEPLRWHKTLTDEKITITTVVPTQLYDLVKNNLSAPVNIRYLIVGGDFLPEALETRARELGWPVIRTYGMTEVCSQLASGKAPGDRLTVLPLHEIRLTAEKILQVKSPSLFTALFTLGEKLNLTFSHDLVDNDGYYSTQDRVDLINRELRPLGRLNQEIKIAGHLTSILTLKETVAACLLQERQYGKAEVVVEDDERKGKRLVLLHTNLSENVLSKIRDAMKPAAFDEVRSVTELSRTELGKIKSY